MRPTHHWYLVVKGENTPKAFRSSTVCSRDVAHRCILLRIGAALQGKHLLSRPSFVVNTTLHLLAVLEPLIPLLQWVTSKFCAGSFFIGSRFNQNVWILESTLSQFLLFPSSPRSQIGRNANPDETPWESPEPKGDVSTRDPSALTAPHRLRRPRLQNPLLL